MMLANTIEKVFELHELVVLVQLGGKAGRFARKIFLYRAARNT